MLKRIKRFDLKTFNVESSGLKTRFFREMSFVREIEFQTIIQHLMEDDNFPIASVSRCIAIQYVLYVTKSTFRIFSSLWLFLGLLLAFLDMLFADQDRAISETPAT